MHNQSRAEKIILNTLQNVQEGLQTAERAARTLRGHADYCEAQGDSETAVVANAAAGELERGRLPEELNLGVGSFTSSGELPEQPAEEEAEEEEEDQEYAAMESPGAARPPGVSAFPSR